MPSIQEYLFMVILVPPLLFIFQLSLSELAKQAVLKLETRKYKGTGLPPPRRPAYSDSSSVDSFDSNMESCAICLEEYRDGQVSDNELTLHKTLSR